MKANWVMHCYLLCVLPLECAAVDFSANVPVRSLNRQETAILTRDIATVKAQRPRVSWAEAVVGFEVR